MNYSDDKEKVNLGGVSPAQCRELYDFIEKKFGEDRVFVLCMPTDTGIIILNGNLRTSGVLKLLADSLAMLANSQIERHENLPPFNESEKDESDPPSV